MGRGPRFCVSSNLQVMLLVQGSHFESQALGHKLSHEIKNTCQKNSTYFIRKYAFSRTYIKHKMSTWVGGWQGQRCGSEMRKQGKTHVQNKRGTLLQLMVRAFWDGKWFTQLSVHLDQQMRRRKMGKKRGKREKGRDEVAAAGLLSASPVRRSQWRELPRAEQTTQTGFSTSHLAGLCAQSVQAFFSRLLQGHLKWWSSFQL